MKGDSRTNNTKRNIVWGMFSKLVFLLGPFVTRSLLIYRLGAEYLGISGLYTSILQVLSLAELGFASAVAYSMYEPIAKGNVAEIARYLNYFKRVYRVVGAIILVLGLALMPVLGYLVEGDCPNDVNMQLAFSIYLGNTVLSYFLFAYKQTLLNAYQRNDVVNKINATVMICQFATQVGVLALTPAFYAYAVVMPVCTIVGNLITALVVRRLFPEFSDRALSSLRLGGLERAAIRKRVAGLFFQRVCAVTRNSLDNIVISAFLGLTMVAAYSNYFVIMSGLLGVLGTIGTAMTAAVGNSVVLENKRKNLADLRLFMYLYSMVSIVCSACLICLYQPFMKLWVGESLVLPFDVAVLMTFYFYVCTMGDMRSVYVNATGIWWELRWRALAETITNVVFNLLLVKIIGVQGVVLATLLSLFLFNFLYGSHLVFRYYFGLEYAKSYYIDHFIYLAIGVAVCAIAYCVCGFIPEDGLLMIALKGVVAALCAAVLLVASFFKTRRFKKATRFLGGLIVSEFRV